MEIPSPWKAIKMYLKSDPELGSLPNISFKNRYNSLPWKLIGIPSPISKNTTPTIILQIVEADFLKYDLAQLFDNAPFAITGNFPYNISTQIVFKTLEWRDRIPEFTGMFQKEVARRICEKEGSKTYGILSVLTQAFYDAEYLFTVKPGVFNPPPKVESGVLRLKRKADYSLPCDEKMLYKVVKTAFQQRRKTLRNSLKSFQLSDKLKEDAIFGQRPEQLSVKEFIALTLKLEADAVSTHDRFPSED